MAFIRKGIIIALLAFVVSSTKAQTVYYPASASKMLKSTAEDAATLLQKAIAGSVFTTQSYTSMPVSGIVLVYDTTITDNQACRIQGNGTSLLTFSAAQDNGLCFGIYQYLQQLGFRFYQPGSIWEVTPILSSPFKNINTTLSCSFKYKTWNISGGHNRWAMDNNPDYSWDTYFGENGHQWALYQRRNGMLGGYRFAGHRTDIISGSYLSTIQSNPCYVACYNGTRTASLQSVPEINNTDAVNLWSSSIQQKFTQYKNTVFGNTGLYADLYRNYNFFNSNIGIEVPDGAQWGNSKDNGVCNGVDYPKESDQQFTLANFTAQKINSTYPDKHFQLYAYNSHADVPSSGIAVNSNMDVQVISTAFQNETSAAGLMNRWYNRHSAISEYHYLNLPQWGGETPMFYLNDMKQTLQRLKEKQGQGIVWEASPAKFISLPFLLAANNNLLNGANVDSSLHAFCDAMFDNASSTMYKLLQYWSDDKTITTGDFIQDNKFKLPLYLQTLNEAVAKTQNAAPVVKQRIAELKAYLHYMVLYYSWLFDQRSNDVKQEKAAALCIYLAKINKLQLVNNYFLIADITSRYETSSLFYQQYNTANGTMYQNGNLSLITAAEIDALFQQDMAAMGSLVSNYKLETASFIKSQFGNGNISPKKKITVKISYTNGYNYPNRSEFYIDAPSAGSFTVNYYAQYQLPEKGYINFTAESVDKALLVLKDFSIGRNDAATGSFTVTIPAAGTYKFSVVSKYKSTLDMSIVTNGNYFYKRGAFLGNKTENYRTDILSLPGYFYIPAGINKVYFSINNSNPGGNGFADVAAISKAFLFKDNNGNTVQPALVNVSDSSLFYLDIPAGGSGTFWQVFKMEQYNLCFANISNITWYAERKPCSNANFTASIIKKNGDCITRLTAASVSGASLTWEVYDVGRISNYSGQTIVDLPNTTSPNAVITLKNGNGCIVSKRLGDDENYLRNKEACGNGGAVALANAQPVLYPNPSSGIFNCMQNSQVITAEEITVTNAQGIRAGVFRDTRQFNISNLPAGMYWYTMVFGGEVYRGKLMKL